MPKRGELSFTYRCVFLLFVVEVTKLAMDIELLLIAGLYTTHDLCIDTEALADLDDALSLVGREVDLHAVTHVKHLIHLRPVRMALLVDGLKQGRYGEHIVFDDMQLIDEVQDLGLRTT